MCKTSVIQCSSFNSMEILLSSYNIVSVHATALHENMQLQKTTFLNILGEQVDFIGSFHISPRNIILLLPQEPLQKERTIFLYLPGRRKQALDSGDKYKHNKCTHQV